MLLYLLYILITAAGGFSEVWKGTRNGGVVAVKITKTDDVSLSFERERGIYTRAFLNHETIATYYGADKLIRNTSKFLCIILHMHVQWLYINILSH